MNDIVDYKIGKDTSAEPWPISDNFEGLFEGTRDKWHFYQVPEREQETPFLIVVGLGQSSEAPAVNMGGGMLVPVSSQKRASGNFVYCSLTIQDENPGDDGEFQLCTWAPQVLKTRPLSLYPVEVEPSEPKPSLREIISDIQELRLVNNLEKTNLLARQAVLAIRDAVDEENIEEWARRIADSVSDADD